MNITNITAANVTSVTDVITLANDLSNGVFAAGLYFVLYVILFLMAHSRTYDGIKAAMASSFVMFVLALLLAIPGWLSYWFVVLPSMVMILTLFATVRSQ